MKRAQAAPGRSGPVQRRHLDLDGGAGHHGGQLTGSALHMGGVMAVSTFPLIVTSWIGGALLDRFSAKRVMVVADLARAVLIFAHALLGRVRVGLIYARGLPGGRLLGGVQSRADEAHLGAGGPGAAGQGQLVPERVARRRRVRGLSGRRRAGGGRGLQARRSPSTRSATWPRPLLLLGLPRPAPRTGPPARVADAHRRVAARCSCGCGGIPACAPTCCWPCSR